jgi:hypothetical protein
MMNVNQDGRYPRRDLNLEPLEYKSEALRLESSYSPVSLYYRCSVLTTQLPDCSLFFGSDILIRTPNTFYPQSDSLSFTPTQNSR